VLAAEQRLRRAGEFSVAIRSGGRAGRGGLLVYIYFGPDASPHAAARAGLVVPKAVGSAVTRNTVRRRLRHLLRERLAALPAGTDVVVRVLPSAAQETYERLAADLDAALAAARRAGRYARPRQAGGPPREMREGDD
jgi:ribonuclease P protein component